MKQFLKTLIVACVLCAGCSKEPTSSLYTAELFVKLIDGPGKLERLELVFQRIELHSANMPNDLAWRVISEESQTYEILSLRNGNFQWLIAEKIPPGSYDKFKIVFNIGTVVIDGTEYRLEPDASIAQGAILDFPFTVHDGETYQLTFDFNVAESIKEKTTINTMYVLKPKIRIQPTLLAGSIAGQILDADSTAAFATISTVISQTNDLVSTTSDSLTGSYELSDLPEGIYTVTLTPEDTLRFSPITIDSVVVHRQQKTLLPIQRFSFR